MKELWQALSFMDQYLALWILLAMIAGILIGVYAESEVQRAFKGASWEGVSIPILIGLLLMMWPILTKVQYERLPKVFSTPNIWQQLALSILLNWVITPFVMLGLAWATLPEKKLSSERQGVILVGIARCIAMVLIWSGLAGGNADMCAIIVCVNSVLQMVLFPPYALLLLNLLSGGSDQISLVYDGVAKNVGIYLGIPLAAGVVTRLIAKRSLSTYRFNIFLKHFSPISLLGLLYTIIVLFAFQGNRIVHNVGTVFRIFVPLILYFAIVWTATFFSLYRVNRMKQSLVDAAYDKAVVQSFTAASNNFELAIAVAVASFGPDSPQSLAATIGPLVEVPVLLCLSYVALWLRGKLKWGVSTIALA